MKVFLTGALALASILAGCGKSDIAPQSVADLSGGSVTAVQHDLVADRFIVTESGLDHSSTLGALLTALDRRDLTVFAVIDHAAGAESAGLELSPSTLVIFGSPKAGTPMMEAEPLMGIELPLRALVYELGGTTYVAVTGMSYLERHYPLSSRTTLIDRVRETLEAISNEATSP